MFTTTASEVRPGNAVMTGWPEYPVAYVLYAEALGPDLSACRFTCRPVEALPKAGSLDVFFVFRGAHEPMVVVGSTMVEAVVAGIGHRPKDGWE